MLAERPTSRLQRHRFRRLAPLLLLVAVVVTGCNARFEVIVEVEEDGSGVVMTEIVLDQEASEALLDLDPGQTLPLADLAQSGWEIGRPLQDGSGETRITATKAFGTPNQFAEIMSELADNGVIREFSMTREQSFGRVDYAVTGIIDPTAGLAVFSDPELESSLGTSLVQIVTNEPYNAQPQDFSIELTVVMPGELQEDGSTAVVDEGQLTQRASWSTDLAQTTELDVALRTTRRSTSAQVLRGVAVVAGVVAALIAFAQLLRVISSLRKRRPAAVKTRPTDARGRSVAVTTQDIVVESEPVPEEAPDAGYKVVALDGMGVLYREGDDVKELLIPFARSRGATAPDDEIVVKARQLSLGRMTPADFWEIIGVQGDPNELDSAYLASHQLMPGVVKYLRALRDSGIQAACITNDAAAWAMKLRAGHSLEGLVDPWVISGSVGVRKPDAPLFEVLRRVTGEGPSSILIMDDDLDNLDAARELGFGTAWFTTDGERSEARGHEVFRGFESFDPTDTQDVDTSGSPGSE